MVQLKEKTEQYKIYKTSVIINTIQAIMLYAMYSYILVKYINILQTLEEPIFVFIGLIFFIYVSLARVIGSIGDIFNNTKYHIKRFSNN